MSNSTVKPSASKRDNIILKADYQGELRRVSMPLNFSLSDLLPRLYQMFNVPREKGLIVKYVDDENDLVMLDSNDELSEALRQCIASSAYVLRLFLSPSDRKSMLTLPESAPSAVATSSTMSNSLLFSGQLPPLVPLPVKTTDTTPPTATVVAVDAAVGSAPSPSTAIAAAVVSSPPPSTANNCPPPQQNTAAAATAAEDDPAPNQLRSSGPTDRKSYVKISERTAQLVEQTSLRCASLAHEIEQKTADLADVTTRLCTQVAAQAVPASQDANVRKYEALSAAAAARVTALSEEISSRCRVLADEMAARRTPTLPIDPRPMNASLAALSSDTSARVAQLSDETHRRLMNL